jgi:hypothetical protein
MSHGKQERACLAAAVRAQAIFIGCSCSAMIDTVTINSFGFLVHLVTLYGATPKKNLVGAIHSSAADCARAINLQKNMTAMC